jgi:8-oxo-dGTP diphosphatase
MNILHIDRVVLIVIKDRQVLVTLGKGQNNWQIPTIEPEESETDVQALTRLAKTELAAELRPETVHEFGTFEAHAHAHGMNLDKTDKAEVRLKCYVGELTGAPQPGERIEKIDFFWFNQKDLALQKYFGVFDQLRDKGLIE